MWMPAACAMHAYILWWGLMRDSLICIYMRDSLICRFVMVGGGKVGVGVANPRASYIYIYIYKKYMMKAAMNIR